MRAELDAARLHPLHVEARVFLFVLERFEHALAEGGRRLGKLQQHERHQFRGEQLVIGKEMQQPPALLVLLELAGAGKFPARRAGGFEMQIARTSGRGRRGDGRTGMLVRHDVGRLEFFLQRRGEQNPLGKFPQFHHRMATIWHQERRASER